MFPFLLRFRKTLFYSKYLKLRPLLSIFTDFKDNVSDIRENNYFKGIIIKRDGFPIQKMTILTYIILRLLRLSWRRWWNIIRVTSFWNLLGKDELPDLRSQKSPRTKASSSLDVTFLYVLKVQSYMYDTFIQVDLDWD